MGISQSNPSAATIEKKFEVFLSFRGETRDGFTNNLYAALRGKSIETFMDDRLEKGHEIGPSLSKTIRESKISVVIFSKDYASSKWCLRELVEIMECRENNGQTVIPVFYNVAVSDVRHQEGNFKDGFVQLEKKFHEKLAKDKAAWTEHVDSADASKQTESCMASFHERAKEFHKEIQNWRGALTKASHVTGWDSSLTRPESKLIDEIVKDVSEKLMRAYKLSPCDFRGLFGFQERLKQVESLLCLDKTDIRIIGIWGMGGLGKTTIADAIFNQIDDDEYGKCFIQNVRQRLEQCGGLVSVLQQEVLSKVLNDQDIKLHGVTLPQHIKERLCQIKVFIVLDDVDDFLKLKELAGGLDRLGPGSRIIITTRRRDILYNCGVNDDYIYEVKGLSNQDAYQLFCEYAFRQSHPTVDLMALSHEILRAIDGNPLGLIVAGSSLLRSNKLEWQSALSRLKKSSKVLETLQISYNGLEDEDKHTFLDIACFFVGEHEDYVTGILDNCSYSLKVLSDRSLIKISNQKIIQMHDLLQEMGREIVCKESHHNPGNRSRLWTQEDVLDTLKNGDGTNAIRGIFLNMSKINKEHLSSQAFKKMKNLRFLKFYDSTLNKFELCSSNACFPNSAFYEFEPYSSNACFPNSAFYEFEPYSFNACFPNFSFPNSTFYEFKPYSSNVCFPDLSFPKSTFYEFELYNSNVCFPNDISYLSNKLRSLNWLGYPLKALPSNFIPENLVELNLRHSNIKKLWEDNVHAPKLKWIILKACPFLIKVSDHLDAPQLEKIYIESCESLLDLPSQKMDIQLCKHFCGFPSTIHHFNNLRELNLRHSNIEKLWEDNMHAPKLKSIILKACPYLIKVSDLIDAQQLEMIDIESCENLLGFPSCTHFPSLTYLRLLSCNKFTRISDLLDAPLLEKICIEKCEHFTGFPSNVHHFNNLRELNLAGCDNLQSFPNNITFPSLVSLDLSWCINLARISNLLDAPLLKRINLRNCESLLEFPPPIHHFNNLQVLNLSDCKNLQSFPNNISFPSLVSLDLSGCINLARISDFLDAPLLERINLRNCKNLFEFPRPVQHFNKLRELNVRDCEKLQNFAKNIHFRSLISLDLSGCHSLTEFSNLLDAPLLERINLEDCSTLFYFLAPFQQFNNLRYLILRDCKNLQRFPGYNIHFPSLICLDFQGCINLTQFPYISGNIKCLYMRKTAIDEVPSSIENLPELVNLDLVGCTRLKHISISICKLKALRELNLKNCSALECFPKILNTMESLKVLDLSGTAIKGLHHSIENLSGLHILCLKECKNLDEVPSSIENLIELVNLDLAECTSLKHISFNICKLKALRELNLRNCFALECFPEILDTMGDLKILDLSGTTIKELHHSIENLSGLVLLCLRECKNLDEVPSSIESLTKLEKLDLAECTSLKHISISICKLKALRELYLSNCSALECFPEILDTMGTLKNLNLSGTAIKRLHHSIENLSGLDILSLMECKNLEILPTSIYNLTSVLDLSGCSKLKNLPGNSVTDLLTCGESSTTKSPICKLSKCYLDFTNCLNLNKTAVINIMELLINQHRDMTTKGCGTQAVDLTFFYPGSEVPGWFKCQTDGSSINIQMLGHDGVNGHLIGLAACAVIEFYDNGYDDEGYDVESLAILSYCHHCHCKDHSRRINSVIVPYEDETLIYSDHVALWYSNASVLELCGECTNYLFKFYLEEKKSPNCRVKNCGVCPIYEKHNTTLPIIANETSSVEDQGFGETSAKEQGKIRKFSDEVETSGKSNKDVIEPHPKRTCS